MSCSQRLFFRPLVFGALLALPSAAFAQATLVSDGDTIAGVGLVDVLSNHDVNNSGSWLVEGSTDNPDSTADGFIVDASGLLWREGQPIAVPNLPGATLGSFDSVRLNNDGDTAMNFFLDPTTSGVDSAVFYNSTLVIQEGDDAAAVTGASPASPWIGFFEVHLNDLDQVLVLGTVNDPAVGIGNVDVAFTRIQLDAAGAIVSATPVVLEDDTLPGLGTGQVDNVESGSHDIAMNNLGDVIFTVDVKNEVNGDKVMYTWIGGTFTKIAEEGTPTSFDPSRNWDFLIRPVDINDNGDYVHLGNLSGSTLNDEVLIRNGVVFKQEGDSVPDIAPFSFAGVIALGSSSGAVKIDGAGNVLYFGDWDDPDTTIDTGLFRNDDLLLQEGVSMVDGVIIDSFVSGADGFAFSDNGRFVIFRAKLDDGRDVIAMLDLVVYDSFCFGDGGVSPGCTDCPCGNNASAGSIGGCINSSGTSARLIASGSAEVASDTLRFEVMAATPMTFGILSSADNRLPNMGPCAPGSGIVSPVLDGLRCVGGAALRHGTRPTDGNGDIGVTGNGWGPPSGPAGGLAANGGFVSGQTRHFQCFYRENPMMVCMSGQNTTSAVTVTFQ